MKSSLLSLLLFVYGILSCHAQYLYGLDATFATNGIHQGDTGAVIKMVVQQDGKIVVTDGERKLGKPTAAMRFNSDGSIDNSFATNGRFFSPVIDWYGYPRINNIILQPDGKIILAGAIDTGTTNDDFFIMRLHPNGGLDNSFGGGGYIITGLSGNQTATSIVLQNDGKILVLGNGQGVMVVAKYHQNGIMDSSFGTNGVVISSNHTWGIDDPTANDIEVISDGRIVLGVDARIDALGGAYSFTAVRLLPDGTLDTSFNHTGIAFSSLISGWLVYCKAMAVQADGKTLLSGYDDSLAVVRFDTSGQLDNGFGTNGLVKLDPAGKVLDMLPQPDGKILLATNPDAISIFYDTCYTIYRITQDGKKDTGFGNKGKLQTRISNEATMLGTVALQSDGKLLAGGSYTPAGMRYPRIMLARYFPDATTSIHSPHLDNSISIYPNPANNYIYIDHSLKQQVRHLSLYSFNGKLLLIKNFPYTDRLSTDGLANGIYYLKLNLSNHQQITKKVIIQNN